MSDPRLAALRADLRTADFTEGAVLALLGEDADAARRRGLMAPARAVLAATSAPGDRLGLRALVRLFLLGEPLGGGELADAFPGLGRDGALGLGLIAPAPGGDRHRAAVSLNPTAMPVAGAARDWWLLSDLDEHLVRGPLRPDHVLGVGGATRTLLRIAPPARGGRLLDLGTGCGVLALRAAAEGASVVATDVSQRALDFAAMNAELNGVPPIDFRRGDRFEPVAGERFDRIVSNPPFVITPRRDDVARYEYRDGGLAGDDLVASVLAGAPAHLAPGGSLQALANWEYRWGENGLDRALGWPDQAPEPQPGTDTPGTDTPGTGARPEERGAVDAWVIERQRLSPASYAETWARDGGARPGSPEQESLVSAWLEDFAERRVTGIGFGMVLLRAGEAGAAGDRAPVRRGEIVSGPLPEGGDLAGHLVAALAAGAAAERLDDAALGELRLVGVADAVERREYQPGAEDPTAISLVQRDGLGREVSMDTALAAFVGACDGELSVAQLADALASLLHADPVAFRDGLLPGVRELIWHGTLAPAAGGADSVDLGTP